MSAQHAIPNRRYFRTPATAPGPAGPQMLTAFGSIRRDPLQFLFDTWQRYGDVVQFPIPQPPTYLVNSPAGVRHVLVGNGRNFDKDTLQYRSLSLVTGEGLLTAQMEPWRRQRPLVQPAFHHETLNTLVGHITSAADRLLAEWDQEQGPVDVDAAMMQTALGIVGQALFGTDLSKRADHLARATLEALEVVVARARVPITPPAWLPTPANRRLRRAVASLDAAVDGMVATRAGRPDPKDMLDLLIAAHDDQGAGLTPHEIRDQIVTFIVAGHETVASALTWAWALLASRAELQERLHAEAIDVFGDGSPSITDYSKLVFARAVFDEALRLYPPAWLITRNALAEDEIDGYRILPNSLIIISPWLIHRHPAAWTDPEDFRPERFLDGTFDRQTFLPFGAGLRQCIGKDFAYVEGVLLLSLIARRFTLRYPPGGQAPQADPLVTIRPATGLVLQVTRRSLS